VDLVLDHRQGPAHRRGDLVVGEAVVEPKQERRPAWLRQSIEGAGEVALQLAIEQRSLGIGRGEHGRRHVVFVVALEHLVLANALHLEGDVARDAEDPRPEPISLGQLGELHVGAGEDLLGCLIGTVGVTNQIAEEPANREHVSFEQRAKGLGLTSLGATDQRLVGRLGSDGLDRSQQAQHDVGKMSQAQRKFQDRLRRSSC